MYRILIAVLAAHHPSRAPFIEYARRSWCLRTPLDKLFVYGRGADREPAKDELFLSCPDDYQNMWQKNIGLCRYALQHGYDFCLRGCDDTYLRPELLTKELFEYDYVGKLVGMNPETNYRPFGEGQMHGGCGIWFSARAMQKIAYAHPIPNSKYNDIEDIWIGEVLQGYLPWGGEARNGPTYERAGLRIKDDARFISPYDPKFPLNPGQSIETSIGVHFHDIRYANTAIFA